jgi:hypothetical protein
VSSILILSTTLLTDRMLRYSTFGKVEFPEGLTIWTNAPDREAWAAAAPGWRIEAFPEVRELRGAVQALRRIVDYSFDFHHNNQSRQSFWRWRRKVELERSHRLLRCVGWGISKCGLQHRLENRVLRIIRRADRGECVAGGLGRLQPGCVVAMSPFRYLEPGVISAAESMGTRVGAFITSWDNLSTKARMPNTYDFYLAWSARMQEELSAACGGNVPERTRIVGAPQFDAFRDTHFAEDRQTFCARHALRSDEPIILYCLGSPNLIKEHYGALAFGQRVAAGDLGAVQVLVRPHPVFGEAQEIEALKTIHQRVRVQNAGRVRDGFRRRYQDVECIRDWVSTFRHADVVINLSSTVAIDAALFDKPIVNLDFDPEPGKPNQRLVKDVNHLWSHFRPIAESGGVALVDTPDQLVSAVRRYLQEPGLHRQQRRWIAKFVCGHTDGRCGQRMAEAILELGGVDRMPMSLEARNGSR